MNGRDVRGLLRLAAQAATVRGALVRRSNRGETLTANETQLLHTIEFLDGDITRVAADFDRAQEATS